MPVTIPESSSWSKQVAVLRALFKREAKTRIGPYNFGIFWALLQPITAVIVLSVVFGFILGKTIPSIPYPLFILSGLLPFQMVLKMQTIAMVAIKANQGLLIFPQVKPMDCFLARFFLEAIFTFASFVIFIAVALWMGLSINVHNIFYLMLVVLLTFLFGVGSAIFIAVLTNRYPEMEKVVPIIQRPLLYVSCVLYPLSTIPSAYQKYILYNPLSQITELTREYIFYGYGSGLPSILFLTKITVVTLFLGLVFYHYDRHKLRQLN